MPKTHIPLLLPIPTNELGEGLQRSPAPSSQHIPLLPVPVQHQGTAAAPALPCPHFALRGTKWLWEASPLPQTASLRRSGWDSLLSVDHRMVEAGRYLWRSSGPISQGQLPTNEPSQLFNTSKDGESTASLGKSV